MAYSPAEVDAILEQLRPVMLEWHKYNRLGEIAILRGGNEWMLQERERKNHPPVKRERMRPGYDQLVPP